MSGAGYQGQLTINNKKSESLINIFISENVARQVPATKNEFNVPQGHFLRAQRAPRSQRKLKKK
jgi:hypothetical protein